MQQQKKYLYLQKLLTRLIICIFLMLLFVGCQNNNNSQNGITIKDSRGVEYKLDTPLTKAISTHNPTLNHLVVLGNGTSKYIAGWGRKDIGANLYEKILPDWNNIEIIGSNTNPLNKEAIVKLNPDIIIISERNWEEKIENYENTGFRTFVCFPEEESFDSVTQTLKLLSTIFGEEDRAKEISVIYDEIISTINHIIENNTYKPKVAFMGTRKYSLAGNKMLQDKMIEKAGGINVADNKMSEEKFISVDAETIVKQNPEYIFIPSYAQYTPKDILEDEKLSFVDAVKNKHVYQFPSNLEPWDLPTCSSALGLCWMTNKLHPNLYTNNELEQTTTKFYKILYNKDFLIEELGL